MKHLFALLSLMFIFTASAHDLTSEDMSIVKHFNNATAAVPIEISKPSEEVLVIEYPTYMYVVDHEILTHIYARTDSDWYLYDRPNTPIYNILREYSHVSFHTDPDGAKYLIIERIDGNGSYTHYYTDVVPDSGNNGTIYMSKDEYVTIGEDYAVLTDRNSRTYYKFIPNN